jgi:hypothetical protein
MYGLREEESRIRDGLTPKEKADRLAPPFCVLSNE